MNIIEIDNLTKTYGKNRGISNVRFNVEKGEIFGFIGPNGAGKSTTIRTILGLIYPTSGSAKIFGLDCVKDAPEIAKNIGYLPSEVFYYDNMKVIDLLKYSASFYKKNCDDRINYLSDVLELDLKRKIDDLSYGNKKKVGIVQGLLHQPDLIILDEPTSGLDPLMQQKFFELLLEENKRGCTILFSSHILSEVQKMCSRVAIIKEGKLLQVTEISKLRDNNYKKISLTTLQPLTQTYFAELDLTEFVSIGNAVSFIFNGDINKIIQKISALSLLNIMIEEPTLEEIFLHFYK